MSNPKPNPWSVRFELSPSNSKHTALHEYLNKLAADNQASNWIRDTLIAALPVSAASKKPLSFPHPVSGVYVDPEDDVRYEPIDE